MGGPGKELQSQSKIADSQVRVSEEELANSREDRKRREDLMQPAIDFNKKVAGGDKGSLLTAVAPMISEITKGRAQSKEAIYEGVPAGVGRDVALAQNETGTRDAIASTKNSTFLAALDKLANIGSGIGSFSLQELGAGITSSSAAANTNQSVIQAKSAAKASTMGFLGQLAGAGGAAFAGR